MCAETAEKNSFDLLTDVLNSLRVCGSLLLHESYISPWSIALPSAGTLGDLLDVEPETRAVAFHLVERGTMNFTSEGKTISVSEGEMIICFGGSAHEISQGSNNNPLHVAKVLDGAPIHFRCPTGDSQTSLACLCGVFYLHNTNLNPLFAALPPILHTSISSENASQDLTLIANLLANELDTKRQGGDFMVQRLLELLCAGAVRRYLNSLKIDRPSWFAGIKDPLINEALSAIHGDVGAPWSVASLARKVMLSPSRFASRFQEVVGESPMRYLSKWRIQVASEQLLSSDETVASIGLSVGYENSPAFIRAFKRHTGTSPGRWRETMMRSNLI